MEAWGRFTARGGAKVEAHITELMREIRTQLKRALEHGTYRAVVLIGGYGRGEGGVDSSSGEQRPHNNFDILIVAERQPQGLKERADRALNAIAGRTIGIDVGVIERRQLESSPALVMWYDMRHGHKHILGDPTFVPSLSQFRLGEIPSWDVRNLLVNRGTLLIINERLLARDRLSEKEKRTVIKHGVKAIIGYGDALLYFLAQYDWSYREKQKRMRESLNVGASFRTLYDEAMEFRFEPDYPTYLARDLAKWNTSLRRSLAEVHLRCEAMRLGRTDLNWDNYVSHAFTSRLLEDGTSPRANLKKLLGLRTPGGTLKVPGQRAKLGYLVSRPRERLPIIFPAAAYDDMPLTLLRAAQATLGTRGTSSSELQRAYLRAWGKHGDTNFANVIRALHIAL